MISQNRYGLTLAICLASLAGFVDALGFRSLGGLFVSFMSGNSTRLAVNVSRDEALASALLPLGIIGLFVMGVIIGTIIGHFASRWRGPAILAFVSVMLYSAAVFSAFEEKSLAIICMVFAMGAENNVFVKEGEVSIGITYMTGTLVKLGQRLAGSFLGGNKTSWLPYLALWLGLILGAVLGSLSYSKIGLQSLWLAGFFSYTMMVTLILLIKKKKIDF